MKYIFPALNVTLALIIVTLVTIATRTWMFPKYPEKVDMDSVPYVPKTLEPMVLARKTNNAKIINSAVQRNLFRKDRRDLNLPFQVEHVVPSKTPKLPLPNLKLKGVLLLGAKKIALMEGDYPVREGLQGIRKKKLERKKYLLGAKIGRFELTEIQKTKVTLNNNKGVVLILNLVQRPEEKIIQRVGNTLIQQDESFDPGNIKKVALLKPSSPLALKQPQPVRSKDQARPSVGMWTRFKRKADHTEQ
jgi:hypothetical protein